MRSRACEYRGARFITVTRKQDSAKVLRNPALVTITMEDMSQ
jgi:hypothetical protein